MSVLKKTRRSIAWYVILLYAWPILLKASAMTVGCIRIVGIRLQEYIACARDVHPATQQGGLVACQTQVGHPVRRLCI